MTVLKVNPNSQSYNLLMPSKVEPNNIRTDSLIKGFSTFIFHKYTRKDSIPQMTYKITDVPTQDQETVTSIANKFFKTGFITETEKQFLKNHDAEMFYEYRSEGYKEVPGRLKSTTRNEEQNQYNGHLRIKIEKKAFSWTNCLSLLFFGMGYCCGVSSVYEKKHHWHIVAGKRLHSWHRADPFINALSKSKDSVANHTKKVSDNLNNEVILKIQHAQRKILQRQN